MELKIVAYWTGKELHLVENDFPPIPRLHEKIILGSGWYQVVSYPVYNFTTQTVTIFVDQTPTATHNISTAGG